MGFLLHKFAHFVHALRLFKALRLFFLTNFPGPTVIPCPTSIPDSRVVYKSILSLTLLGLGLIKINDVSANFNNPRPSLILNN